MGLKNINRDSVVAGFVALSAFAASAQHIWHVTMEAGNPSFIAALHPAGIDGLIYIGIRAMQRGNKKAGGFAIAYGALYSLAFNAASYGAFKMPVFALAACMPMAMFFAFLIVHGGHKAKDAIETVERIVEVQVLPKLLPIVPFVPQPAQRKSRPAYGGRTPAWDVSKVVEMIRNGEADDTIRTSTGVSAKSLQRARRVLNAIDAGASDETIVSPGNITARLVTAIRAAATA